MKYYTYTPSTQHIEAFTVPKHVQVMMNSAVQNTLADVLNNIPANTEVTLCPCIIQDLGLMSSKPIIEPFTWDGVNLLYTVRLPIC